LRRYGVTVDVGDGEEVAPSPDPVSFGVDDSEGVTVTVAVPVDEAVPVEVGLALAVPPSAFCRTRLITSSSSF